MAVDEQQLHARWILDARCEMIKAWPSNGSFASKAKNMVPPTSRCYANGKAKAVCCRRTMRAAPKMSIFGRARRRSQACSMPRQPAKPQHSLLRLLGQTLGIYFRGFFQYLFLTLLIVAPSLCAQFAAPVIDTAPNIDVDLRKLVSFALAFCMSVLALALWPIYIAGIQILTAQMAGGDRISFLKVLNAAASFWPRVAFLCVYVALCFTFWTVLPVTIIFSLIIGTPSLVSIFAALLLLAFQVWITGRLFINFMFWQQFAVLENCTIAESLVRSRELARSRRDVPWYRRPLWRGGLMASLWFAIVIAINWPILQSYFQTIAATTDPQVLVEKMRQASQAAPAPNAFWIGIGQAILRPLLGIGFVLLYLDSKIDN
jgi:hypothetical protein